MTLAEILLSTMGSEDVLRDHTRACIAMTANWATIRAKLEVPLLHLSGRTGGPFGSPRALRTLVGLARVLQSTSCRLRPGRARGSCLAGRMRCAGNTGVTADP